MTVKNDFVDCSDVILDKNMHKFDQPNKLDNSFVILPGGVTESKTIEKIINILIKKGVKKIGIVNTFQKETFKSLVKKYNLSTCTKEEEIFKFLSSFSYGVGTTGLGFFERLYYDLAQISIVTSENEVRRMQLLSNFKNSFCFLDVNKINNLEKIDFKFFSPKKKIDLFGASRIGERINNYWSFWEKANSCDYWHSIAKKLPKLPIFK